MFNECKLCSDFCTCTVYVYKLKKNRGYLTVNMARDVCGDIYLLSENRQ